MSSNTTLCSEAASNPAADPSKIAEFLFQSDPIDESALLFTFFPELPPELRNKIWNEACFETRIIDLWLVKGSTPNKIIYGSYCHSPAILHTSREARGIGLQHYVLVFGTAIKTYGPDGVQRECAEAHIYVNWDYDIIFPLPFLQDDTNIYRGPRHDRLDLLMFIDLSVYHKEMKRVAIPASHSDWIGIIVDGLNLSEIILHAPAHYDIYYQLDEVATAFDAGTRFKIELFKGYEHNLVDDDERLSWYLGDVSLRIRDLKLHTQPTVTTMYMKLHEI